MFDKLKNKMKGNKKKTGSTKRSSSDRRNTSATQGSDRYKNTGKKTSS